MAENSQDKSTEAPLEGENREGEQGQNLPLEGDPKTAAFWEKNWLQASTRLHVGHAMRKAWEEQADLAVLHKKNLR